MYFDVQTDCRMYDLSIMFSGHDYVRSACESLSKISLNLLENCRKFNCLTTFVCTVNVLLRQVRKYSGDQATLFLKTRRFIFVMNKEVR
jgi:hypothetical protein